MNLGVKSTHEIEIKFDDYSLFYILPIIELLNKDDNDDLNQNWHIKLDKEKKIKKIEAILNKIISFYRNLPINNNVIQNDLITIALSYLKQEEKILTELNQKFENTINIFSDNRKNIGKILKNHATISLQEEFEFYKGSTDWSIRFNNQQVILDSKNYIGLRYIHKLLLYKGESITLYDLEGGAQEREDNSFQEFQLSQELSVRLIQKDYVLSNIDEELLLSQLKRMTDEKPEYEDSLEENLYYYAALLNIVGSLINIVNKSYYIKLHKIYKEKYIEYEKRLKGNVDELFVKRVISKSRTIKASIDFEKESRKIRQRVQKNISNAIESISSSELKEHLKKYINYNNGKYTYDVGNNSNINWKLLID